MEFNDAAKRTEDEAVCEDRHLTNQISVERISNAVRYSLQTTINK